MEELCQDLSYNYMSLEDKFNPFCLKGMKASVQRITKAINNREKIVIYGYYDVDGITSVSLLMLLFRYLNADVEYYIPGNVNEQRDISYEVIKNHIIFLGADLIITVGCGINSCEEVNLCKKLGIDVIITDYRECKGVVPDTIIVDPKQKDCLYSFKELSGTGITYKLAEAISMNYKVKCVSKYLDLCMLGTISNDVPLIDENKLIVEEGILHLCNTKNYGIRALIKENKVFNINEAAAYKLAFTVIPTINAVGRMDNSRIAVELFTTDDKDRAEQIAKYLNKEVRYNKNIRY